MSSEYRAAAGRASADGGPHRERYSDGDVKPPRIAHRWRTIMVIASCTILGSFTMIAAPTTAGAQSSDLELSLSAPEGKLAVGESVEYTYTVANNGAVEATSIAVTDSLGSDVSCPSTTVAAGESITCTGSYTITAGDVETGELVNTATVSASSPQCASQALTAALAGVEAFTFDNGDPGWQYVVDYVDSTGATVATIFTRAKSDDEAAVGSDLLDDKFIFQYGDFSTDEGYKPIEIALEVANDAQLDAGTIAFDGRGTKNLASFTGANNATGFAVVADGKASGVVLAAENDAAEVVLDATGTDTAPDSGSSLVANTRYTLGDTEILVDEAPAYVVEFGYQAMKSGESAVFVFNKYGAALDVENNGWSASLSGCVGATSALSATATQTTSLVKPSLTVVMNQPTGKLAVGEDLTYKIDVTNGSPVRVAELALSVPLTDDDTESCPETALEPDATMACTATYTVTQADMDKGRIDISATVEGTIPDGTTIAGSGEVSTLLATGQTASLSVKKVGAINDANGNGRFDEGEMIKYAITATNTGTVMLTNISIDDPLTADEACPAKTLDVNKTLTCTASHVLTKADIDAGVVANTATVSATDPNGAKITAKGSTSNTLKGGASIVVEKGQPEGNRVVGATLKYPITVTNNGTTPLVKLAVTDSLAGAVSCDYQSLNPGAKAHCTASYVVKQADGVAGKIVNTATAVAKDSQGIEVAAADYVTTTIAPPAVTPTPTPTPGLTVTPAPVATATPIPMVATPTPTPKPGTGLAVTGSNSQRPAMAALGMIMLGLILVSTTHKRRNGR